MDKDSQDLFECIKSFSPHFDKFVLDHLVYFAGVNLNWSEEKTISILDTLTTKNIITAENDVVISIN